MPKPTDSLPPGEARYVEEQLRALEFTIPTEPGRYTDCGGEEWELKTDGHWYDKLGDTRPTDWNYVLAAFGPWTLVEATPDGVSGSEPDE